MRLSQLKVATDRRTDVIDACDSLDLERFVVDSAGRSPPSSRTQPDDNEITERIEPEITRFSPAR